MIDPYLPSLTSNVDAGGGTRRSSRSRPRRQRLLEAGLVSTSPDDILGHARIARAMEPYGVRVATGEHCHNRVMFKQLLQSRAIGFGQVDACRLGGLNEVLAELLMAAKYGVGGPA